MRGLFERTAQFAKFIVRKLVRKRGILDASGPDKSFAATREINRRFRNDVRELIES